MTPAARIGRERGEDPASARGRAEPREGLKVFLDAAERDAFDRLRGDLGMSQREAATRLVRWFLAQDDVTQRAVLGLLPPSMVADIAQRYLERLAAGPHAAQGVKPIEVRKVTVPERGGKG